MADEPGPVARGGIIDLTAPGATSRAQPLQGEWGFAWSRFLSPVDGPSPTAVAPVPGIWNELTADGKPPGPDGYATYTLLVRCPEGHQLALSVPPQRTAMWLYINGQLVATQGTPGTSMAVAQPVSAAAPCSPTRSPALCA